MTKEYEAVIGLEVHAQLRTASKIFCGCKVAFGDPPNTHTCPVCLGMPGALPVLNQKAVTLALRATLAANCEIRLSSRFDRKNYFYPDLPKGYQISQFALPIAEQGYIEIPVYQHEERGGKLVRVGREGWKKVHLTRIHMEEDAGKNIHTEGGKSIVDVNRAGVPLIEIVGAPELHSGEEAAEYVKTLRHLLISLEICDGNMEEGSLRCDANVSLRPKGEKKLGTRIEIKNLNSFRFIKQAIEYEIERQKAILSAGEAVTPQTRGYDSDKGLTYKMRDKEGSDDYRYFPEPDLPPLSLDPNWVTSLGDTLPELYREKVERFERDFGLPWMDAETLAQEPDRAAYFEKAAAGHKNPRGVANWVLNDLLGALEGKPLGDSSVSPESLGALVSLIEEGKISGKIAKQVFGKMLSSGKSPQEIVEEEKLEVVSDVVALEEAARKIVEGSPKEAAQYRKGKEKVLGHFVGQLMKATKGKADPKLANEIFQKLLKPEGKP